MPLSTAPVRSSPEQVNGKPFIPPLENGDRLTRAEFERRYEAMPHITKAELIEGEVYMPSPVRIANHAEPHQDFNFWATFYKKLTPGIRGGDNGTVRLDLDNEPQPDIFLFIPGEGAMVDSDDYVTGVPDWISEITASSVTIDLGKKFKAYQRNGVKEYVVWRVQDREIDWFILRGTAYERLALVDGFYKSEALPGLWIDPAAVIRDDSARQMAVLQQGIASPEHQAFVTRLNEKKPA